MATERPSTMEEYPRPLAQVWTRLATRGRDTLLVVNPASGNDLTGNVTFAVGAYQGLVVPNEGDVSLPTSELELPGVVLSSWAEDGWPPRLAKTDSRPSGSGWNGVDGGRLVDGSRIHRRRSPQGLPAPVLLRLKGGAPRPRRPLESQREVGVTARPVLRHARPSCRGTRAAPRDPASTPPSSR